MIEQARVSAPEPGPFSAYLGIDWGDKEHRWALQAAGSNQRETGKLLQTPEAIEEWAISLAGRFGERVVAVAVEQSRGALVSALSKYRHIVIHPVPPAASAAFRAFAAPSGNKNDPLDARMLLDILLCHRDKLRPLRPDSAETRQLQALVEKRRQLVDEKTAQTNCITSHLKICFPQVLEWFDALDCPVTVAFLRRWPTLPRLQADRPEALLEFLHKHNCRSQARNQERLEQMVKARTLTTDPAVIEPAVLMILTLLDVVEKLRAGIAEMERAIEKIFRTHPDSKLFSSFPGAGPALAPRLLAALGSDRSRFASAAEVQTYSGIAPVSAQSGRSKWIHFRWACPKFLRQSFHEYAGISIQFCDWARSFYDRQRDKGKAHHAAVRSLAYKWIRILFACWRDGKLYCDGHHTQAVQQRSTATPRSEAKTPTVDFQFKTVAGFAKLSGLRY